MGQVMRSLDWSQTPLGSVSKWPQSLKTCVRIMLTSRQPMFVWWGDELINLYNDAYKAILGGKHPEALGQSASYVWREIWDQVGPRAESAILNNEGTYDEALLLIMERNGYPEETYYTFSYSPVPNDQGGTGGIICANTDDTQRIIGERQLALLRELAARTADARTFEQACTLSVSCLETNPYDLPFAMIYLVEADKQQIFLAGTCGIERNHVAVPETVTLDSDSVWPFAEVIRTQTASLISLGSSFDNLPTGAWQLPPHQAIAMPIAPCGQTGRAGILIVGLNPFRIFDDQYKRFIDLVSAQIAASIANAQAYEEERKRAEALAELDRAKTVFFSNVSHEFRTPLTLMLSPLEDALAVADDTPFATQRQSLEMVHRNGLRLLKLVNTLLDFSRIEAGRISAVYEPTDLATNTLELTSVFRSAIERAGLRLHVNCPTLVEPVYVDREMWEKIVLNLLSNAFKFTFVGEITVSLQSVGERIKLSVCDTGIGIPTEELPHLFKRFHRVKGAQGRTFEGSGIGLSLVQELVKLHGGTVEVSSVLGEGSCFTVLIPTGYSHLPQDRIGATRTLLSTALGASPYVEEALRWLPEEEGEQGSRGAGEKRASSSPLPLCPSAPLLKTARILLVDDNADMRDYVKRLLSQEYEVETVTDGVAALAAIAQHKPDLVLTDVMMPLMDGFELLRSLRSHPVTREIPIILLSARAGEESRVEGLQAGADDYLIKPFSARELLARVEANLKMARLRHEAVRREQELRSQSIISQQAAEAANASLEKVLASIKDQFVVLDHEWRYTYVNDRVVEVTGKRKEDLLGKSIWELFPESVGSEFYIQAHRAVSEQTPVQFEYFYPPWNRHFENRIYPSDDGVSIFITELTEHKRIQVALQESTAILNAINQTSPTLIFVKDLQGRLVMANPSTVQAIGKPETEIIKKTDVEFHINRAEAEQIMENDRLIMQTGQLQIFEEIVEVATGRRTYLSTKSPYRDSQGNIIGLIGIAFDITERKQAEEALRQSEERSQLAIKVAKLGTWRYDLRTNLVELDERMREIWGESDDAVLIPLSRVMERIHPDDQTRVANAVSDALDPRFSGTYDIEYRILWNNGIERWVSANGQVQFEGAGVARRAVGFIGTALDITDSKQAEATLRQSEERYRYLVESIPQLVWTADTDGMLTDVNQRWSDFTGLTLAQGQTAGWQAIVHPDDVSTLSRNWAKAQRAGTIYRAEGRMRRADGVYRWHLHQAVPLKNDCGRVIKWFGTATDIEEQKQLEQQRQRLLEQEQVARTEAETANRIKDEFLAVLSHELRSPLNPILGWSKLLLSGRVDATKTTLALQTIERNAKLQAQLIEDLLDVSRILRGKLRLEMIPVNLGSTIEAAIETVQLAASAKSIQIQTVFTPIIPKVLGDSARLQQVIWNLLSNAVKFTDSGGQVEIRLECIDSQAQIQVTDTGKGIHPNFLPHVFEYFRQADATTTRKFGGLGLGLAIVRHLVELHGGTVRAESPGEGQGATFTVCLPLLKQELNTKDEDNSSPPKSDASLLTGIRVLVVDDEKDTRELIAFILDQRGANVTTAASAREALQLIAHEIKLDVLVSDIGMPEMDGYMLMRQIRAMQNGGNGKNSQIRAIALTAYAGEMNQRQAFVAGFQHHIAKPVDPEQLVQAITAVKNT
ncbi:histidine kinase [Brasilonema sp. UFV-L1]|nr:ATP-binding protein [Brasilonema sp. UFV-L1]NMG09386.1 histidine kinase [Brasilonema sp. UFV-L1]